MKRFRSGMTALGAAALLVTAFGPFPEADAAPKSPQELAVAANDILDKNGCFKCHGDGRVRGKLNLRQIDKLLQDKSQKVILTRSARDSLLIQRIEDGSMPDSGTLPRVKTEEVAVLVQWITAGAPAIAEKPVIKPPLPKPVPPVSVTEVFRTRCASCHGGARPESGLRIFEREKMLTAKLVLPKDAAHSPLFQRVTAEDDLVMPPPGGGRSRLTPDEVLAIKTWIDEGAPPLERFVTAPPEKRGDEYVMASILKDVRALKDAGKTPALYRYFSFNHLLAEDVTAETLDAHRQALAFLVNSLSRLSELERPEPIEDTKTVYRLDISKVGWDRQPLKRISKTTNKEEGDSSLNLFDLVLLEYPYGAFFEGSDTYQKLLEEYLEPARMVAPVPFVHGDWFINAAGRPPLYEDMLQLPFSVEELEKLLGVDSRDAVERFTARRAGVTDSGVSKNNRVVERVTGRQTAYFWKSYDFSTSRGLQNMFRNPVDLNPAGGEMVWSLPNGLQGYFVTNHRGGRIEAAPTDIVTDKFAADKTVRTGLSCMRCHETGIRGFRDDIRPALEGLNAGAPGFDLQAARRLYPEQKEMDVLVQQDTRRFLDAVKRLYDGKPPALASILEQTSVRFLDRPLPARAALAELGAADPEKEQANFGSRQLARAGLAQLAYGGVVRRDTWEDYYDQVIREVRNGKPLVPLDGVTRAEYQPPEGPEVEFEMRDATSGKKKTTFVADDEVIIVVKNRSKGDLFIDLIGTSIRGFKVVIVEGTVVKAGKEFRFPSQGAMKVKANIGKELITLFASNEKLPSPELVRLGASAKGEGQGMLDRVVHPFYKTRRSRGGLTLGFDPATVVKKTLEISTE